MLVSDSKGNIIFRALVGGYSAGQGSLSGGNLMPISPTTQDKSLGISPESQE